MIAEQAERDVRPERLFIVFQLVDAVRTVEVPYLEQACWAFVLQADRMYHGVQAQRDRRAVRIGGFTPHARRGQSECFRSAWGSL